MKFKFPSLLHFLNRSSFSKSLNFQPNTRWLALDNKAWKCATCDQTHFGLFDLGKDKPDAWLHGPEVAKNILHEDLKSLLSDDLCIVNGEHYFVRCVLYLPIIGTPNDKFGYGVWSSLSKPNFMHYRDTFNDPNPDQTEPWFGWLSNSLNGYPESFEIKCNVSLQKNRQRPLIQLEETKHPLSIEQHQGITLDRLFEIYELNGHKIQF
jgi:hypothetical protein